MIALPEAAVFEGSDGLERLHRTIDDLNKSIPDGLATTIEAQAQTIAELTDQISALQAQAEAQVGVRVFREENVDLNVILGREIVHNLGTVNTIVSVEMQPADSNKSWIVSEKTSFRTNENQLSIYFDVAPASTFDVTIIGFA